MNELCKNCANKQAEIDRLRAVVKEELVLRFEAESKYTTSVGNSAQGWGHSVYLGEQLEKSNLKYEELKTKTNSMYSILKELAGNSHFYDPRVIPEKQSLLVLELIKEFELIDIKYSPISKNDYRIEEQE